MGIPAIMRALQQTSLNGLQDLRLITDAPVPVPGPGEVLVRVTAAGVNFGDISQAHGTFLGGPQPPYLAGFEAAGEIATVGEAVTGLEPGAPVIGAGIGCGAFAEYTALPAAAVMPVPTGWAEEQAAAPPRQPGDAPSARHQARHPRQPGPPHRPEALYYTALAFRRVAPWRRATEPPQKPVGGPRRPLLVFRRPCQRTRRWYP
ncbi:MAG: alcohol dehydrogenase catalytic domain-containing protein [Streptosporangiaceae bacterium]